MKHDYKQLDKEMMKVKGQLFIGSDAGLIGQIACMTPIRFREGVGTACTDGRQILFDPNFFKELNLDQRVGLLYHEIQHIIRLHHPRGVNLDPRRWNIACDYVINQSLLDSGYKLPEGGCVDEQYKDKSEEEIYKILENKSDNQINKMMVAMAGDVNDDNKDSNGVPLGDIRDPMDDGTTDENGNPVEVISKSELHKDIIQNVMTAIQQAKMTGSSFNESIIGSAQMYIDQFLAPVIPWEKTLQDFFTALVDEPYISYKKRNRRYYDIYMPGTIEPEDRLESLNYYIDVSGSISDDQVVRFNSEIKYVFDTFKPKNLTVVLFDTGITEIHKFTDQDDFNNIKIIGRGGTCLECVRDHILETSPTAAVIFSDLYCHPMEPFDQDIPLIWAVVDNKSVDVFKGDVIYITA